MGNTGREDYGCYVCVWTGAALNIEARVDPA